MHPHISPVNPQARRRIPKTSHPPRTPSTRGARFLPLPTTSHTTNHESAPGCSFTTCHVRITSRRARTTPPHPVDASHPPEREEHPCTHAQTTSQHIEEHLPAHARGRITPRTGTLPTPHPHDSSHPSPPPPRNITHPVHPERGHPFGSIHPHLHADTPTPSPHPPLGTCRGKGHEGQADTGTRARQTSESTDHTHIHHKNSNGDPCPTTPCTTTEHVLDESTRNPRVTSTQHHQSPCAAIDTRTTHHENPTRREPHPYPLTPPPAETIPPLHPADLGKPLPVGNRITPPQQPHHRTAASHSPRTHDRTTTARARVTPPPGGTLQEQVGCGSCSPAHPTCSTPMKEPPPHRSAPTTTHSGAPHRSATTSTASTSSHRRQFHPRPKNTSAHHPTTPAHHVKPLTTVEKYTRIW